VCLQRVHVRMAASPRLLGPAFRSLLRTRTFTPAIACAAGTRLRTVDIAGRVTHGDSETSTLFPKCYVRPRNAGGYRPNILRRAVVEVSRQEEALVVEATCQTHRAPPGVEPLLYTPRQAAQTLALSRTTVYQLMSKGRLPFVLIGSSRRIPVAALIQFVAEQMLRQGFTP